MWLGSGPVLILWLSAIPSLLFNPCGDLPGSSAASSPFPTAVAEPACCCVMRALVARLMPEQARASAAPGHGRHVYGRVAHVGQLGRIYPGLIGEVALRQVFHSSLPCTFILSSCASSRRFSLAALHSIVLPA